IHGGGHVLQEARLAADRLEVPVEVRDDGEAIPPLQAREELRAPGEALPGVGAEPPRDPGRDVRVRGPELLREAASEKPGGLGKGQAGRQNSDDGVSGRVESPIETRGLPRLAFGDPEPVEPLLPRDPVGIQRPAKIEEQSLRLQFRLFPAIASFACQWKNAANPGTVQTSSRPRRTRLYAAPGPAARPSSRKTPTRIPSAVPMRAGIRRNMLFRVIASASIANAASQPAPGERSCRTIQVSSKPPHQPREHHAVEAA